MFSLGAFLRQTILKKSPASERMVPDSIIVRCGEMFLKTGHLAQFEGKLIYNLKAVTGVSLVVKARGRLLVPYFTHHNLLQRIFGINSYSLALRSEKNMEAIQQSVLAVLKEKSATTFKIETIRSDKTFPLDSRAVNIAVGQFIEKTTTWQCDFHAPHVLVKIEINRKGAYIFTDTIPGAGGLPVGTAGKVVVQVENKADILAGILMMKRGCTVIPLMVGEEKDISLLQKFSPTKIKVIELKDELELHQYVQQYRVPVLVTGENFERRKEGFLAGQIVFRPLVAYTPPEISTQIQKFQQVS